MQTLPVCVLGNQCEVYVLQRSYNEVKDAQSVLVIGGGAVGVELAGTVPYFSIIVQPTNYLRHTVITTVITADTQYRMLLPIVVTHATILTLPRYLNVVR